MYLATIDAARVQIWSHHHRLTSSRSILASFRPSRRDPSCRACHPSLTVFSPVLLSARFPLDAEQTRPGGLAAHKRVRPIRLLSGDGVPFQSSLLLAREETSDVRVRAEEYKRSARARGEKNAKEKRRRKREPRGLLRATAR